MFWSNVRIEYVGGTTYPQITWILTVIAAHQILNKGCNDSREEKLGVIFIMQETLAWVEVSKIPPPAEAFDRPQLLANDIISFP